MFDWIDIVNNSLRNLVGGLEPGTLSGDQAALLVRKLAEVERLAAAGKALAAARVDESNRWRRDGHRSAAHWMAAQTGSSVRGAMEAIDTAKRVAKLPQVEEAFRAGELSAAQAGEISAAATASPQSEHDLLNAAKTETLAGLREHCRRTRHAALPDEAARNEAIRLSRYFRPHKAPDGAFEAAIRGTNLDGATLMAALDPFQKQIFDNARRNGDREPYEAYAFDALIALAQSRTQPAPPTATTTPTTTAPATTSAPTSGPKPTPTSPPTSPSTSDPAPAPTSPRTPPPAPLPAPSPSSSLPPPPTPTQPPPPSPPSPSPSMIADGPAAMIHVRVDHTALRRGHTIDGEICEIPGIGPIPVATATMLAADAIINVLLVDGVDVTRIAHTGRTVTAHQRTALRERSSTCEVPGCDARNNLEIDHDDPWRSPRTPASTTSTCSAAGTTTRRPTAATDSPAHPETANGTHPLRPTDPPSPTRRAEEV